MNTRLVPILALAAAFAATAAPAQQVGRTTWSGVYSEAQAARGQQAYAQHCGTCHAPDLAGTGEATPLAGPEFSAAWNGQTVGDLLDRTAKTMPQQAPGSLPGETYADVIAFVLKTNGFPAGAADLPAKPEVLSDVKFEATRPQ